MADIYSCEFESLPCANPKPILVIRRPAATREPLSIWDSAGDTCRAGAERNNITEKKLLYTQNVCVDVCFQRQVLEKCGCLSNAFQFTPEQQHQANGIVCGNLSFLENTSYSSIIKGVRDYLCSLTTPLNPNICEGECIHSFHLQYSDVCNGHGTSKKCRRTGTCDRA